MTVGDGRGQNKSQPTRALAAHIMTSWAPVVIRLAVAVLSGGDDVLILRFYGA